jgi:transaldolase
MKYLIDTADQIEIYKWKNIVVGATSNPSILRKCNMTAEKFYENNKDNFDSIFIQVQTLDEARSFKNTAKIVFKAPLLITKDFNGWVLLKQLKDAGFRTCATITYDLTQFNYACELGCNFSIVLIAKNENKFFLDECVNLKERNNYKTKIIAASFRSIDDVNDAIDGGADYVTVPPKYMDGLFANEAAIVDYNKFYGIE